MQKVKNYLETAFGKVATTTPKTVKIHVKEIDGSGICLLNALNLSRFEKEVKNVLIKRSGTGITIIVIIN